MIETESAANLWNCVFSESLYEVKCKVVSKQTKTIPQGNPRIKQNKIYYYSFETR